MSVHDELRPELGRRIVEARRALGLSQAALAARVGRQRAQVQQWETGRRSPSAAAIADLAMALGVSSDWLLGIARGET